MDGWEKYRSSPNTSDNGEGAIGCFLIMAVIFLLYFGIKSCWNSPNEKEAPVSETITQSE